MTRVIERFDGHAGPAAKLRFALLFKAGDAEVLLIAALKISQHVRRQFTVRIRAPLQLHDPCAEIPLGMRLDFRRRRGGNILGQHVIGKLLGNNDFGRHGVACRLIDFAQRP